MRLIVRTSQYFVVELPVLDKEQEAFLEAYPGASIWAN